MYIVQKFWIESICIVLPNWKLFPKFIFCKLNFREKCSLNRSRFHIWKTISNFGKILLVTKTYSKKKQTIPNITLCEENHMLKTKGRYIQQYFETECTHNG